MAIPFDVPTERRDFRNHQPIQHPYLVIENLLKEILTLIRWGPIWAMNEGAEATMAADNARSERRRAAAQSRLHQQQQQQSAQEPQQRTSGPAQQQQQQQQREQPSGHNLEQSLEHSLELHQALQRQTQITDQVNRRDHGHHHRQRQQRAPLPDLVTSCGVPAAEVVTEVKPPANTLTLQVELCPECYQNGRRLKVVGVSELVQRGDGGGPGQADARTTAAEAERVPDSDEEESMIVNRCSKVKQRLLSLLQPTNIDASLLTAVFVIVGWKMFIKQ